MKACIDRGPASFPFRFHWRVPSYAFRPYCVGATRALYNVEQYLLRVT